MNSACHSMQMEEMALFRDGKMAIDDDDGVALEIMLSLEANEPLGEVEVTGLHSKADTFVKDFTTGHSEAEKTVVAKGATGEAVMEDDERFEEPKLEELRKSTRVFTAFERPVGTVEGNAMETESPDFVERVVIESTSIMAESLDKIEFVGGGIEKASENTDARVQIEIKEPDTLEVTEKVTTITNTSLTEIKEKADLDVGTRDPAMASRVFEKTNIKAKAICQDEEEGPCFRVECLESTSTGITRFDEELGTYSEADADRIVHSIMNDIAAMEGEDEDAGQYESNTLHQKVKPAYETLIGTDCQDLTCQDHIGTSEGHA